MVNRIEISELGVVLVRPFYDCRIEQPIHVLGG
jgi:hypothetical protein